MLRQGIQVIELERHIEKREWTIITVITWGSITAEEHLGPAGHIHSPTTTLE